MMSPRARRVAIAALATVVLGEFVVRGPLRALGEGNSRDLTVHYGAARVWLHGGDPYDMREVAEAFLRGGGPESLVPTAASMPSVYPPVTHAVEAPLALLGWRAAVIVAQATSLVLVLLALVALARMAGLTDRRAALFIVGGLALAPLHTGLAAGQVAIPSAALLVLGWAWMPRRPALAGVLAAIGAALKPQLAVPFAFAALARPNVRWLLSAGGVFSALFGIGELRLALVGHEPLHEWLQSAALAAAPGAMNSPGIENSAATTLINLDMLLTRIVPEPAVARATFLVFAMLLAAFAVWRMRAAWSRRSELYPLALLCIVSLLAMYHRAYDAVLLWIPLAAFIGDWKGIEWRLRALGATAFAGFLVPGPTVLAVLASSSRIPRGIVESSVWRIAIIPHQVWLLSAAAVGLTYMLVRESRRTDAPVPEPGVSAPIEPRPKA